MFPGWPKHTVVVVQSLSGIQLFATPWTAAHQAPLSTISWSLLKFMSIESLMPSNHLILCHPPFLLPSIFKLQLKKILISDCTFQGLSGYFPGAEGKGQNTLWARPAPYCTYPQDTERVMAHALEVQEFPPHWSKMPHPYLQGPAWSDLSISLSLTIFQALWSSFGFLRTLNSLLACVVAVPSTWNTLLSNPHMIGFFLSLDLSLINVISSEAPFLSSQIKGVPESVPLLLPCYVFIIAVIIAYYFLAHLPDNLPVSSLLPCKCHKSKILDVFSILNT